MKKLWISLLWLTSSAYANTTCDRFAELSNQQKSYLQLAHFYGSKYDLAWTLPAIALRESNAGAWRVNLQNDYGIFQINIDTAARHLGETNRYRKMEVAQRLIYDDEFGASLAASVLDYFRKGRDMTHGEVWREMIMSYRAGYTWKKDARRKKIAETYFKDIQANVKLLRKCTDWGGENI